MSSPYTMTSRSPVTVGPIATGPTRHGNPNPRAPHQKINPPASANHPSQKPTSSGQPPRWSVGRQVGKRPLSLTEQSREGDRKKRLAEEDASRATKKPKLHHDTAAPAGVPEKRKEKEKELHSSKPTGPRTDQTNGPKLAATTAPQAAKKKSLTLWDMFRGEHKKKRLAEEAERVAKKPKIEPAAGAPQKAKEEALARKAGKAIAKPSTTDRVKAAPAAKLGKEKRRVPDPDEHLQPAAKKSRLTAEAAKPSYTDQVKGKPAAASSSSQGAKPGRRGPDYNADTIGVSAASQVEKPPRFMTEREKREQRRAVRQYRFAFEAINAADETQGQGGAPAPAATKQKEGGTKQKEGGTKQKEGGTKQKKEATNNRKEDQSPRPGTNRQTDRTSKQAGARAEDQKQLTTAKEVINGQKKHHPNNTVAKQPNGNPKVGNAAGPKLKSKTQKKVAPPRRTDHPRGKSPAIDSDSKYGSDSDSEVEEEEELSEKEKRQRALAALKGKRLVLQAARAAKSSPPAASQPDSSSSPSSRSTTTETREPSPPSPPTPVLDSITAIAPPSPTGSDPQSRSISSETLRASSEESGNNSKQSKSKGLTRSEVRQKFFKD